MSETLPVPVVKRRRTKDGPTAYYRRRTRQPFRLRDSKCGLRAIAIVALAFAVSMSLYPRMAAAANPSGLLSPGTYSVKDWENGVGAVTGSLVIDNSGYYTQTLNVGSGQIELWLFQPLGGTNILLEQIYMGGLYFTSDGTALPNSPEAVMYRPYVASNILQPGASWGFARQSSGTANCPGQNSFQCLMYSTSGGVTLTDQSVVKSPEQVETTAGFVTVQEIDTTLTLGGNGSGSVDVVQFETPGDPSNLSTSYISRGPITVLGSTAVINTTATLGTLNS